MGPRPVGSHENEVLTVGYLLKQIESIRAETAAGPHQLTVDVQRPTGTFSIDFLGGFTSFYDRVTNIAVRLEPKGGAQHLMLANCHFDTVANSPGTRGFRPPLHSWDDWPVKVLGRLPANSVKIAKLVAKSVPLTPLSSSPLSFFL